jgi:hypothetical protein
VRPVRHVVIPEVRTQLDPRLPAIAIIAHAWPRSRRGWFGSFRTHARLIVGNLVLLWGIGTLRLLGLRQGLRAIEVAGVDVTLVVTLAIM